MSESKAVLRAPCSFEVKLKVVMDCVTSLNDLGKYNNRALCWVSVHEGLAGN